MEQAGRLLDACEAEDSVYADAVAFALLTGLRHGEVLGLRWSDVDGDVAHGQSTRQLREAPGSTPGFPTSLNIRQALQRVTGQGMVVRPPKTAAGERTIALGPQAAAVLSRVKGRQKVVSIERHPPTLPEHGGGSPVPVRLVRAGGSSAMSSVQAVQENRAATLVFAGVKETALRRHFEEGGSLGWELAGMALPPGHHGGRGEEWATSGMTRC